MISLPQKFCNNLVESVRWSRRQWSPIIAKRLEVIRQYVGRHYSNSGSKERVPLNFIRLMLSILQRNLVPRTPRCMLQTRERELRAIANALELWANDRFLAMGLEKTFQRCVTDAALSPVGLVKVGVAANPEMPDYNGPRHDYGQPYVDNIDVERAVFDMAAARLDQMDYVGHRITVPKDLLAGQEGVDQDLLKKLSPDYHTQINEQGDEKTERISQSDSYYFSRLREYVDLWELYLPVEGLMVTFPVQGNTITSKPLRIEPYVGLVSEEHAGPFYWLGFDEVPGNLLPAPPVHNILDMHDVANRMALKTFRQALRQKTLLAVQNAVQAEGERIKKGGDGDIIPVSNPDNFREVRFGGADSQNAGYLLQIKQLISYFGGNFDAMGGLAKQADTLGQDKMLADAASQSMQYMQAETVSFARRVMRGVLWYEWHSKKNMTANIPIPGMPQMTVPMEVSPEDRKDAFFRTNFQIDPHSMQSSTPQQKLQKWLMLAEKFLIPGAGAFAAQGAGVDLIGLVKKIASMMDIHDVDDVLVFAPPPPDMAQGQGGGGGQPQPTSGKPNGNYTRTNVSSPGNQENAMIQQLMNSGEN